MSTLTNIALNARSMNGLITISDGQGTVIENGTIDTDILEVEQLNATNFTTNAMIANSLQLLRTSTPAVNTLLGTVVDVGKVLQNAYFDTVNRFLRFYKDNPANINDAMITIDQANGDISIVADVLELTGTSFNLTGDIAFMSSTVSFPNSSCSFNSGLPTSILTPTLSTQLVTKDYVDNTFQPTGSYATLGGNNAFTGTNTFNTNLPTSSIASATLGTQFITRAIADGRFGQLNAANTWNFQNTFSTGILPRRAGGDGTDIQLGGNNQFQFRQAASQYNIGIGALTIVGDSVAPANNIGKRNIACGHQSLQTGDNINDCIAIGYQAMQNCGSIRTYGVASNNQIAIGNFAIQNGIYGTSNVAIGTNALRNCTSGNGSVVIAHNGGVGLTTQGTVVIIGSEAAPTIADNGFVCVGYRTAGFATGQANRCVFIGEQAGLYNNNGYSNTHIGGLAGQNNTTGSQLTCLGTFAGGNGSINNAMNSVAIGCNSQYTESYEFVIGGNSTLADPITFPRLTLPNKNRINCCQFTGTPTTFTIDWRTNEYVVVNSATCTQINLPQAIFTNQNRVGAAFHICRTHLSTSNLIITAFGTEKINWKGSLHSSVSIDSWVMSISFVCVDYVAGNGVWTVFTYNDRVTLATDANKIQTLSDSTNVNYPVCFTTIATTGYNNVYANSSLNYNPSTSLLTVPNITSSGTITGNLTGTATNATNSTNVNVTDQTSVSSTFYPTFVSGTSGNLGINVGSTLQYRPDSESLLLPSGIFQGYKSKATCFQYLTQNDLITSATTLTNPLRSYYPFTMKTAAGYIITLPEVNNANVGTQLTFKRIGGALQILTIGMSANQPSFLVGNAVGTLANFQLIGIGQSCGTMVAIQSQDAGAGTFSNTAGSTTVNITGQTSGTLSIGGKINLNGVDRWITAYSGGSFGGTGNYIVNSAVAAANTGQPYTSSVTYGWSVTTIQ
jgi:hypothetical protein